MESKSGYGAKEFEYAEPFANALVSDPVFRTWVLRKTKFAEFADEAWLLNSEMQARRNAGTWWRSHFTESCRCQGCRGQETDLLAIFEIPSGFRFALHIEVKHPGDRFKEGQAAAYPQRAQCWVSKSPKAVPEHAASATAVLFSETKRDEFTRHLAEFDTLITIEDVRKNFPAATAQQHL